jgi:hypothetical protein
MRVVCTTVETIKTTKNLGYSNLLPGWDLNLVLSKQKAGLLTTLRNVISLQVSVHWIKQRED